MAPVPCSDNLDEAELEIREVVPFADFPTGALKEFKKQHVGPIDLTFSHFS